MFKFFKSKTKKANNLRIFYSTDLHGSNICFHKFCNAYAFYKADILILGGDWTSKMIVPIIPLSNSNYRSMVNKKETILKTKKEMKNFSKQMGDMGFYPKIMSEEEFDSVQNNPDKQNQLFKELMVERVREWGAFATEKLKKHDIKIYCAPGNDDELFIDEVIQEIEIFELAENKRLILSDGREMITCAWTNPTPWQTPRECGEGELYKRLEKLANQVENLDTAIFNLHAPPYNCHLDECPDLDENLKPKAAAGQPIYKPVGSTSVREIIEKKQPFIGLHGHIHEGKGSHKIGRTTCINPGSQYNEGVLQGVVITVTKDKVSDLHYISG